MGSPAGRLDEDGLKKTYLDGWLRGDTISGSYFSGHERSEAEAHGRWQVVRKSRAPG
jgi:hypothetical protein